MYVCPRCKGALRQFFCEACAIRFPVEAGIPRFLVGGSGSDHNLREIYDDIYRHHTNVWVDQGRAGPFQRYLAELVRSFAHERLLEIGCGEGELLAALPGTIKFGLDPSVQALLRAKRRSNAECAVARCEQLPFPDDSFDVALAIGVMEHFEVIDAAITEIHRVLTPSGCFIALIQTDMTRLQRVRLKIRQYVFPSFQPLALMRWFAKWLRKSTTHPIVQPLRRSYTADSASNCLQRNGLQMVRVITTLTEPEAPLGGPHVAILVARKAAVVRRAR